MRWSGVIAAGVICCLLVGAVQAAQGPGSVVKAFFEAGARGDVAAMKRLCTLRATNHGEIGHGLFWRAFAAVGRSLENIGAAKAAKNGRTAAVVVTYNRRRMLQMAKTLMSVHLARLGNKLKAAHAKRLMERFLKLMKTQPPKLKVILKKHNGRWVIDKFKRP
ncbi:MAG: hypothetical protein KJ621_09545 [Proteobacteria bacterium]|nr:hypothetical protein [Pseudomonadota bacterium]MBU1741900.1 hypothetical protein [Pseudomonadota bacterium]